MKAVAVTPGIPGSIHPIEIPEPSLSEIPDSRGVLIRVVRVGFDVVDREIIAGRYGVAPEWSKNLIIGHESLGVVEAAGERVTEVSPGDFVVGIVRLTGTTIYDRIGAFDMTTDREIFERGINRMHGFFTEYYVDRPEYLVRIPPVLSAAGVLLEPFSVVEKGIEQAFSIQQRLQVWQPQRAAVIGAGTMGLLAGLVLRLRGLQVCIFARTPPPHRRSRLAARIGACYHGTDRRLLHAVIGEHGPFDLIFEASGVSSLVSEIVDGLGPNGILVMSGLTGEGRTMGATGSGAPPCALGNRVVVGTVSSNRSHFETGIRDMVLATLEYPGWLEELLTHRINGLDNFNQIVSFLGAGPDADRVKICCEVSPEAHAKG